MIHCRQHRRALETDPFAGGAYCPECRRESLSRGEQRFIMRRRVERVLFPKRKPGAKEATCAR